MTADTLRNRKPSCADKRPRKPYPKHRHAIYAGRGKGPAGKSEELRGGTSASGHAMCYCARLMGQPLPLALTKS